jgi:hypothetical protein
LLTFEHFVLYEQAGPDFATIARNLSDRMYLGKKLPRLIISDFDEVELQEIDSILKMAKDAPPSSGTPSVPSNGLVSIS